MMIVESFGGESAHMEDNRAGPSIKDLSFGKKSHIQDMKAVL